VTELRTARVRMPYSPRRAFVPFHKRTQRWACLVAHRRAGKTVAAVNDLIRAAITALRPHAHYAYVAPFRSQAKSVAWDYLKRFAAPATASTNEAELLIQTLNGSRIQLFGADNADAMRGLGFDGIYLDEYGDFRPSVWGNVIRPTLSDRAGWAVLGGTPKGRNQFYDAFSAAQRSPDWFVLRLPASSSGILPETELHALRAQLTEDQYRQEYECSFDAAILGAFYGTEMREADEAGRICPVPIDPEREVYTAWDIGWRDDTAIWFWQVARGEIHVIDHHAISGATISELADTLHQRGYRYARHYLPHDARAKTLASGGRSVIEQLAEHLGGPSMMRIVPDLSVQDGIQAARMTLPRCWFDAERCREGVEALRQYQREYDEDKRAFRASPRHDWTSHSADAFRMLSIAWREEPKVEAPRSDRPLLIGPANAATLEDMWAASAAQQRSRRI
jgi:phage terminase large subunit